MTNQILQETNENTTEERDLSALQVGKSKKNPLPPEKIVPFSEEIAETIEAILFAAGHAVPYTVLSRVLDLPLSKTKQIIYSYSIRYNECETPRGVMMLTYDDSCQLCTKPAYLPYIREALGIRRNGNLSNSSIETLAVIAYNQPVTRAYVDTVRGVDSSYVISVLLERNLIESKGRVDAPGRPMLYGTTPDFLRCFGLSSIADLPGVSSQEAAEMLSEINRQMELELQDPNQLSFTENEEEPTPDKTALAIAATDEENIQD